MGDRRKCQTFTASRAMIVTFAKVLTEKGFEY